MKKILLVFLVLAMMLSFVACGEGETGNTTTTTSSSDTNQTTEKLNNEDISVDEIIVVDNSDCLIKITDAKVDNIWGLTFKVSVENRSSDKNYTFTVDDASINGVVCSSMFLVNAAAGKKANDEITFLTSDLNKNGIGSYTDVEMTFRVYDSDDFFADDVVNETIHVYPFGEDKAINFVRESKSTDNVIIDNEYITAIVTGYSNDDIFGYTVDLFVINKSDKKLMLSADNTSVNDIMLDPIYAETIPAGKSAFTGISWFESDFEENSIASVEEIEFTFSVSDYDDWSIGDYVNETIVLNP